jgi:hypothetical protein
MLPEFLHYRVAFSIGVYNFEFAFLYPKNTSFYTKFLLRCNYLGLREAPECKFHLPEYGVPKSEI